MEHCPTLRLHLPSSSLSAILTQSFRRASAMLPCLLAKLKRWYCHHTQIQIACMWQWAIQCRKGHLHSQSSQPSQHQFSHAIQLYSLKWAPTLSLWLWVTPTFPTSIPSLSPLITFHLSSDQRHLQRFRWLSLKLEFSICQAIQTQMVTLWLWRR